MFFLFVLQFFIFKQPIMWIITYLINDQELIPGEIISISNLNLRKYNFFN